MARLPWVVVAISLVALALLSLRCTSAPGTDPLADLLQRAGQGAPALAAADPTDVGAAMLRSASLAGPRAGGVVRHLPMPSTCRSRGTGGRDDGVPVAWTGREPRSGRPTVILWTSRAVPPYPDEPMVLALQVGPPIAPVSLAPWGHLGCWLVVPLEHLLAPDGALLRQVAPGVHELRWTPDDSWVGVRLAVQALYATPSGPNGWLASAGVEVIVGGR